MLRLTNYLVLFLVLLLLCSCKTQEDAMETNTNEQKSSTKTSLQKKSSEPLVESLLNELDKEEFLKQYNKLPSSHVFKVSKEISETGKMSKKEMSRISEIDSYDFNDVISLKGLRFFQNLDGLTCENVHIADIQDVSFLSNIRFFAIGCTFEENLGTVFQILNRKGFIVALNEMDLNNLDFLRKIEKIYAEFGLGYNHIADISALENFDYEDINRLDLENNEIADISVLRKFKDKKLSLNLSHNKISDISVFREFTIPLKQIYLTGNRIMDVSPLQKVLDQNTSMMIGDNCILDYSSIEEYMEKYYYKNNYYSDIPPHKEFFRFDKPPKFMLTINQKEIPENQYVYFDTEDAHIYATVDTPAPACDVIMFLKQLGGTAEYDSNQGVLSCTLEGKNYIFKDFDKEVDCDGEKHKMKSPLKRMQGNIPYLTIEDMCKVFGLEFSKKYGKPYKYSLNDGDLLKVKYIKKMDVSLSSKGK